MAQIGLDLSAREAAGFDKAYYNFVERRLSFRPDVETKLVSYPVNQMVQRRVVSMSCPDQLKSFTNSWRSVLS